MALAGPLQCFSFSECCCKNKINQWGKCSGESEAREENQPETCHAIPATRTNGSRRVVTSRPLTPLHASDQKPFVFRAENHVTLITPSANRLGQTQSVRRHNGVFEINKIDYVTDLQVNDLSNGSHLSKSGRDGSSGQNGASQFASKSKLWFISEISAAVTVTCRL